MTAREQLDRCLRRFVEHAVAGEDERALTAFADAQALMVDVRAARDDARAWVFAEQQLVAQLADGLSDSAAQASLSSLRGRGGRR